MNFFIPVLVLSMYLGGCHSTPVSITATGKIPQVQGHRGSRGTHPENSIPGFEEALEAGANWLELDLVLSKDGVPVLSHDPVISPDLCLDRAKKPLSRSIPIASLTFKELKSYDCGSVPNPSFPDQKTAPGQTFISLEDVLVWKQKTPEKKVRFNIETKTAATAKQFQPAPGKFVDSIIRLLRKYHQLENSMIQSFDFRTLMEAKKLEPSLQLSALFEKPESVCKVTHNMGVRVASPRFSLVTPGMVEECHKLGVEVHPWTLNEESDWRKAVSMGVDGIITDYPRKLVSFLGLKESK